MAIGRVLAIGYISFLYTVVTIIINASVGVRIIIGASAVFSSYLHRLHKLD